MDSLKRISNPRPATSMGNLRGWYVDIDDKRHFFHVLSKEEALKRAQTKADSQVFELLKIDKETVCREEDYEQI